MSLYNDILFYLNYLDTIYWGYVGFLLVAFLGIYLSIKFQFFQIFKIKDIIHEFFKVGRNFDRSKGIHPLKIFFSSVGGMVGIGNVVGIITAVQIGGPGSLFWVWLAAPLGALIKYSEIFLGMKYRITKNNTFEGGPMYYLKAAFKSKFFPITVAILLCVYGVEIYQFNVICDSLSDNMHINKILIIPPFLMMVLYACRGGIKRVATICSILMPFFMIFYTSMCFFIIIQNFSLIREVLALVFKSAFTGHAAIGGFAGSSLIVAIKQGISTAVYSGDIGIGYDSIINSQSGNKDPSSQGSLAVLGIFIDNFICTLSILVVLMSSLWQTGTQMEGSKLIQLAFSKYFPYMNVFMPFFIFLTGYSTIIAYFAVGIKCASYLSPKKGDKIYYLYAIFALIFFSFFSQRVPLLIMSLSGAGLISINLIGIYILRDKIQPPFMGEKVAMKDANEAQIKEVIEQ
ncbi:MAG: Amino-acid carrier protein AlsT [Candidatus Anoxychlamydiales bacterium]|nr:Amino-acid carrier protein AlsT [Candidatus Anoxychlamydiales bacterium]NGX35239.1 Amino-acid carrier protein AlsT [Candidatus Anoxychlamydiales bacterium]